ncbi:MAG: hypothetical protein NXI24_13550 [bacterium]|nr:hypothetical protein [bacterium]
MQSPNTRRGPFQLLGILAGIVLATLLLDALFFGRLVFAPENRTSWDSFPWYNFEMQYRRLLRERDAVPDDHDYVLIVGSSIAKYSVQKRELEAALARTEPPRTRDDAARTARGFTVEVFSHAAMLPTDLSFYVERIRSLRPDLVVYLTGPADLDLERYAQPHEIAGAGNASLPGYDNHAAETFIANRHPMRVFYPRSFAGYALQDLHALDIGLEQFLRLSFRESFYALRFEDAWWDPLVFNLKTGSFKAAGAPVTSYLNYQGVAIPEGLWREGHSVSQFTFSLKAQRQARRGTTAPVDIDRIYAQIPGALAGVPGFHLNIFMNAADRPQATVPREPVRFEPSRGGWQEIALPPELAALDFSKPEQADVRITIQLSHVLAAAPTPGSPPVIAVNGAPLLPGVAGMVQRPAELAKRLTVGRGLRLPGNFGLARLPVDQAYLRRPAWEDWRLQAMSAAEYRRDFLARIEPVDWRAPRHLAFRQLNQIRLAKYVTNWYEFDPRMQQARDLERFARGLTAGPGPRLLLVNNPENPLTLAAYENNAWYRGYLKHMRGLAADRRESGGAAVFFADHHARLPENLFLDTHHLTYGGLQAMGPVYAAEIARALDR